MPEKNMRSLNEDIRNLLLEGKVTTQEGICTTMESLGHPVNQSKISRLLRKIGAVKSKNEKGQIVYRLPQEPAPPTLACQLSSLIMSITFNETNIIVCTSPGSAQLIARILDHKKDEVEILGTIAGDNAIFIAPKSINKIATSVDKIRELLFE